MAEVSAEEMASLNAAKQHLRAAMKVKLKVVSQDSILSQSTADHERAIVRRS
jgi:hypothetical protein